MKQKSRWIAALNILLVLACAALQIVSLTVDKSSFEIFVSAIIGVALVYAIIYAFNRYRKGASYSYKIYFVLLAFAEALRVIRELFPENPEETMGPVALVATALSVACTLILAAVPDLGKKKSYIACGCLMLANLCRMILALTQDGVHNGLFSAEARLLCAILAGVMIYEKYQDKAERHKND